MWTLIWWSETHGAGQITEEMSYRRLRKYLRRLRDTPGIQLVEVNWSPPPESPIMVISLLFQGFPDDILRALDKPWGERP